MSKVSLINGHIDSEIKQTNYERIRNMSVEGLADWLANGGFGCRLCPEQENRKNQLFYKEDCDGKCEEHCKQWLESEVDTE